MKKMPLAEQEAAINGGFNYMIIITADDLTQTGAGTAQTINALPIAAFDMNQGVMARVQVPFANTKTPDPAFNSTAFTVGDSGSATQYLASLEANANNNITFNDGVTNGTTTVTSATATFVAGDVGKAMTEPVPGTNWPAGTTIASRTNATTVVLSAAATTTATTITFSIGGRVATPVTTPELNAAATTWKTYAAADNLQVVITPLPGTKILNNINVGEIHIFAKMIRPSRLSSASAPQIITTK